MPDAPRTWTVLEILQRAEEFLQRKGVEDPRRVAEALLCHILKMARIELYVEYDRPLSIPEQDAYRTALVRAGKGEPLQYITGGTSFYGFEVKVDKRVLIPRPETEGLVELVLKRLEGRTSGLILDAGTGSGCIALALAAQLPAGFRLRALDISPDALLVAEENLQKHRLRDRVELLEESVFQHQPPQPYHLVVSNPPYVDPAGAARLPTEVRAFEPGGALFAPENGLAFYRFFGDPGAALLVPGGEICLELPGTQTETIRGFFASRWEEVEIHTDLSGRDRYLCARRKQEPGTTTHETH